LIIKPARLADIDIDIVLNWRAQRAAWLAARFKEDR
jgi:hypothetical protein